MKHGWLTWALLIAGLVLICAYDETMTGVLVLLLAVGIIFAMREAIIRDTCREEAEEEAERMADELYNDMMENTEYHVQYDRFVVLGKGFK